MMTDWLALLGPEVANHLWQSTVFAVVAWVATLLLRRNAARVRFGVWLAASMKFLVPFSLLIGLGELLPKPQYRAVAMPVASAVDTVVVPFSDGGLEVTPVAVRPSLAARLRERLPEGLATVWLAGVAIVLAVWWVRWWEVARTLRQAVRVEHGREWELLQRVEVTMRGRRRIPLLLSGALMEPGIFGVLWSVLVWPERLSERLDDEHIEAILAHELIHTRRRDNLTAALHMLVEAAFWFHPIVWWMERRMVEERERACDEAVVALGSAPGLYADSLLKACRFCVESPLPCVSGITGADLKRRIVQIMTAPIARKLTLGAKLLLLSAASLAIAMPILLGHMKATFGLVHTMQVHAQSASAQGTGATPVKPMAADAHPSFAVATIKPHDPASNSQGIHNAGDRVSIRNLSITSLMMFAYSINKHQVIDLPAWSETTSYDIEGKTDTPGEPNLRQQQEMLENLLADRFQLKFHREKRELPVYAIQLAKGGAKLKPAANPQDSPNQQGYNHGMEMTQTYTNCAIPDFVLGMQFFLDRPVVDQTGITGRYDFTFRYTADEVHSTDPNAPPGLFTAVQEQLGLKFEPTKAPVDVFVIDHAEKPSVDGAELPNPPTLAPVSSAQTNTAPSAPPPQVTTPATLPEMRFEVASIRPSPAGDNFMYPPSGTAENFSARMATVESMIGFAYNIRTTIGMSVDPAHFFLPHSPNLIGSPGWVTSDKYDLTAKADAETVAAWSKLPKSEQQEELRGMMRALLADRFHLAMKHDTRELPVWVLVVSKGGPKFAESARTPTDLNDGSDPAKPYDSSRPYQTRWKRDSGLIEGRDVMISEFDDMLWSQREIDSRKILDQTGLKGRYDLKLKWSSVDDPREPDGPALFTAIQEQLGLKLESTKAPIDVLVIDHIDRPLEN